MRRCLRLSSFWYPRSSAHICGQSFTESFQAQYILLIAIVTDFEIPSRADRRRVIAACAVLALLGIVLGWLMRNIRFDDPFITYRFSLNLARGAGFVYNAGAANNALITTAPLYALLLALPAALGIDIAAASYWIGVIALIVAACALFIMGRRKSKALAGFIAGALLIIFPLVWLTMGFETPLFIAVALLAFLCTDAKRDVWAGVLAGVAIGLRGDGFIITGLVVAFSFARDCGTPLWGRLENRDWKRVASQLRTPIKIGLIALAVYAPLAIGLTLQFGSPLPTTLQTKSAQAVSGLTGFYPNTSYPEGALILIRAYFEQTPLFALVLLAIALGSARVVVMGLRMAKAHGLRWVAQVPFALPVAWALLHFAGYTFIRVAPYVWYYAPMLAGLACLAALGIDWIADLIMQRTKPARQQLKSAYAIAFTALIALPLLIGVSHVIAILQGATPPAPSAIASKVLPETKVVIYERVGQWLNDNTPATATLGITELGVMGFHADRTTHDFLGLTQPQYLSSIRQGDFMRGLIHEQPDYLALTNLNSLYDGNPQEEDWFRQIYTPAQTFDDARFWGSPITVWQRVTQPITPAIMLDAGAHDLGDGWQVTGVAASSRVVTPSVPLILSIRVKAGDAKGNRELRVQPIVVQRGDGLPVRSRVIHTNQFRKGEEAWVDFPILPPADARKGAYDISVKWLDSDIEVIAGRVKVPLGVEADPNAEVIAMSSGFGVERLPDVLSACTGASTPITITWRGGELMNDQGQRIDADLNAFVHIRDAAGETLAQHDAQPRNGAYPTSVWSVTEIIPDEHTLALPATMPAGTYDIVVGLYDQPSNARLPVAESPFRTADGAVKIGEMEVRVCR